MNFSIAQPMQTPLYSFYIFVQTPSRWPGESQYPHLLSSYQRRKAGFDEDSQSNAEREKWRHACQYASQRMSLPRPPSMIHLL